MKAEGRYAVWIADNMWKSWSVHTAGTTTSSRARSYRRYYDIIPGASAVAVNVPRSETTTKETVGAAPKQAESISSEILEGPDGLICRCDFSVRNAQYVLLMQRAGSIAISSLCRS